MKLDLPEPGTVFRYAYLWANERASGHEEARKDRPVLALAVTLAATEGRYEVMVLAITRSPPATPTDAVSFPMTIKHRLGLGDEASWIVTTEANAFVWPGPDLRPIPGRRPVSVTYGTVSESLLREVARSFLENRKRQRARLVARTS